MSRFHAHALWALNTFEDDISKTYPRPVWFRLLMFWLFASHLRDKSPHQGPVIHFLNMCSFPFSTHMPPGSAHDELRGGCVFPRPGLRRLHWMLQRHAGWPRSDHRDNRRRYDLSCELFSRLLLSIARDTREIYIWNCWPRVSCTGAAFVAMACSDSGSLARKWLPCPFDVVTSMWCATFATGTGNRTVSYARPNLKSPRPCGILRVTGATVSVLVC